HALRTAGDEPNPNTGRRLLGDGLGAVLAVVATLREHPLVEKVSEAGSVRRRKETFRDLDVIATSSDPAALTDSFTKLGWVDEIAAKGPSKATVVSNDGLRFDLRVVPPESYGSLPLRQRVDLAVAPDLDDLLLDRLADSLQLLRPPGVRELDDRAGRLPDRVRGTSVRHDAERVGALELERVGEQVELLR